jgi:dTDP-4-dehydrorhamnose 3,5-epimerase
MKIVEKALDGLVLLEPRCFQDERGWFMETYRTPIYQDLGISEPFHQDNVSFSHKGVLRGLHFQNPNAQGKLVSVLHGAVFDVGVDLRVSSPTFGKWYGAILSSENHRQLWLPPGFAHGFLTLSDTALFSYKCTDIYTPAAEQSLHWDCPDVGIAWPRVEGLTNGFLVAAKDAAAPDLRALEKNRLFP